MFKFDPKWRNLKQFKKIPPKNCGNLKFHLLQQFGCKNALTSSSTKKKIIFNFYFYGREKIRKFFLRSSSFVSVSKIQKYYFQTQKHNFRHFHARENAVHFSLKQRCFICAFHPAAPGAYPNHISQTKHNFHHFRTKSEKLNPFEQWASIAPQLHLCLPT